MLEDLDPAAQQDEEGLAVFADLVRVVHPREAAPVALERRGALGFDDGAREAQQRVVVLLGAALLRDVD